MVKRIMIISEQPMYSELTDEEKRKIPKEDLFNQIRRCNLECCNIKEEVEATILPVNFLEPTPEKKGGFYNVIKKIEKFLQDNKIEYYRTHYIKHHTELTDKKNKRKIGRICADKYLNSEIEWFQPDIILSIGELATNWLIENNKEKKLRPEIKKFRDLVIATENGKPLKMLHNNYKTHVLAMDHPSGSNAKNSIKYEKESTFIKLFDDIITIMRTL